MYFWTWQSLIIYFYYLLLLGTAVKNCLLSFTLHTAAWLIKVIKFTNHRPLAIKQNWWVIVQNTKLSNSNMEHEKQGVERWLYYYRLCPLPLLWLFSPQLSNRALTEMDPKKAPSWQEESKQGKGQGWDIIKVTVVTQRGSGRDRTAHLTSSPVRVSLEQRSLRKL